MSRSARDLLRIRDELAELEAEIDTVLQGNMSADLLVSIPGFERRLAADFLAATGADFKAFETPDRLASFAGLAPVPRDSGKIFGNHHRPRRYDRRLLNACFQAAFIASRHCPVSRSFYERKRQEGKSHKQALIALARRRINVIWAIYRDQTSYNPAPAAQADHASLTLQNDSESPPPPPHEDHHRTAERPRYQRLTGEWAAGRKGREMMARGVDAEGLAPAEHDAGTGTASSPSIRGTVPAQAFIASSTVRRP